MSFTEPGTFDNIGRRAPAPRRFPADVVPEPGTSRTSRDVVPEPGTSRTSRLIELSDAHRGGRRRDRGARRSRAIWPETVTRSRCWRATPRRPRRSRRRARTRGTCRACGSPTASGSAASPAGVPPAAELVVLAVPSRAFAGGARRRWPCPRTATLLSLTKGLEPGTGRRLSEVAAAMLGDAGRVAVLSGPNHAEEIARGTPAATVIASAPVGARRAPAGGGRVAAPARLRQRGRGRRRAVRGGEERDRARRRRLRRPRLRRQREGRADHARPGRDDAARRLVRRRSAHVRRVSPDSATWSRRAARRTRATARAGMLLAEGVPAGEVERRIGMVAEGLTTAPTLHAVARGPRAGAADHRARPRAARWRVAVRGRLAADGARAGERVLRAVPAASEPLFSTEIQATVRGMHAIRPLAVAATCAVALVVAACGGATSASAPGAAGTDGKGADAFPASTILFVDANADVNSSAWQKVLTVAQALPGLPEGAGPGAAGDHDDGSRRLVRPGRPAVAGRRGRVRLLSITLAGGKPKPQYAVFLASKDDVEGGRDDREGRHRGRRLQGLRDVHLRTATSTMQSPRSARAPCWWRTARPPSTPRSTRARATAADRLSGVAATARRSKTLPDDNVLVGYVDGAKVAQLAGTAFAAAGAAGRPGRCRRRRSIRR